MDLHVALGWEEHPSLQLSQEGNLTSPLPSAGVFILKRGVLSPHRCTQLLQRVLDEGENEGFHEREASGADDARGLICREAAIETLVHKAFVPVGFTAMPSAVSYRTASVPSIQVQCAGA